MSRALLLAALAVATALPVALCSQGADEDETCVDATCGEPRPQRASRALLQTRSAKQWLGTGANSTSRCQWWCESDIKTNGKKRHCGGDMDRLCGDCDYCQEEEPDNSQGGGACQSWCESDIATNGKDRHCLTGMKHLCGGCSYCQGYQPGKRDEGAIGIASYNLMSWCTEGKCHGKRMRALARAVAKYRVAVLGTQEHGDSNAPYNNVRGNMEGSGKSGLTHRGAGTYYDPDKVEPVGDMEEVNVFQTYRKCSGQIYRIKGCSGSNCEFAFFNTHWDHGHHWDQAGRVVDFMKRKANGRPCVLTGDFNVWGSKDPIGYIKDQMNLGQASPDGNTWCAGGTVDYILADKGRFSFSGQVIDSANCDAHKCAWHSCDSKLSDHNLLVAGVKPVG